MKTRLSEKSIKLLKPDPHGRNLIVPDGEIAGFGLRITRAGSRAFVLNYRIAGRERRLTLGSRPDWSVTAAREEAKRLKRQIDSGVDPLAAREEARKAPTITDLIERYFREHVVRLARSTVVDQTYEVDVGHLCR
jgi:hypothetical protein